MTAWLVALVLAATPLEAAQLACEKDFRACPERDRLQAAESAQNASQAAEAEARAQEQRDKQLADAQAAELAEVTATKRRCGRDFRRVAVGMKFARVRQCAGVFSLREATASRKVYESAGGLVWVSPDGTVSRVLYRR